MSEWNYYAALVVTFALGCAVSYVLGRHHALQYVIETVCATPAGEAVYHPCP